MPATPIPTTGERQLIIPCDDEGNAVGVIFDAVNSVYRLAVDSISVLPALTSVAINDAGAGVTEVSVKADGVARTDGSLLVGGEDTAGDQQAIKLDTSGRQQITDQNGAVLGTVNLDAVEETVELANTDIFPSDATAPRDGWVDIEFAGDAAGIWSLKLVRSATTIVKEVKDGMTVNADKWQSFAFPVKSGDDLNLRVDTGMTVTALLNFRDR